MKQLQDMILRMKSYSKDAPKRNYKCEECRDYGYIRQEDGNFKRCACEIKRLAENRMKNQGFTAGEMTMKQFNTDDEIARVMKSKAQAYIDSYPNGKSMAVLGQVGSGKTHLVVGLAQEIMNKGHEVTYMPYVDMMTQLRQAIFNAEEYARLMDAMKKTELLVIDDFLKGNILPNDLGIVFELINYRYLNKKPFVISSEKLLDEIIQLDEALGTRISQVTKGFRIQVKRDSKRNKRLL